MKSTESPWNFFEDFENEEEGELKRILLEKGSDEMLYIDEQTKKFRKRYINNNLTINDKGVGSEPFRIKKDPDGNQYLEIMLETAEKHGIKNPEMYIPCLLYTSPSPRDQVVSRMPSSA